MPELWLVCEGEKSSVDVAILNPVLSTILAAEIVVEPAGGHSQLSTVARFLEVQRGGRAAYVKDRDYMPREAAEVALQKRSPHFLLRRHSIENYLLHPQIMIRAFKQLRKRFEEQARGRVPQWLSALPSGAEQIADGLRECARRRTAEEACLLATQRLWDALPTSVGQIQKRRPSKPTAGDLSQPDPWREALCREIESVRSSAEQASQCEQFRRDNVAPYFDRAYADVTAYAYVSQMEFLVDYHGRDLLKGFHQWLLNQGANLRNDRLCEELIPAAVQEYEENRNVFGRDDFRDLANGVRLFAGLTALP